MTATNATGSNDKGMQAGASQEPRFCGICQTMKPAADFSNNKTKASGKSSDCKACNRASSAAWRHANPDASKASQKNWVDNNRERNLARMRNWREMNRPSAAMRLRASGGTAP